MIAQEIKKIFPEFVEEGKASGGFMSVSYDHLTLPLINATKQLANEQDDLKDRVKKLEKAENLVKSEGGEDLKNEVAFLRNIVYILIGIVSLMAIAMMGMFVLLRKKHD